MNRETTIRAKQLKLMAAVIAGCTGRGLLTACGGGADEAPLDASATATANAQGRRSLLATVKVTTMTTPIVSQALNACVETVASSWDIKLASCNDATQLQKFTFTPVASGSDVYTMKNI